MAYRATGSFTLTHDPLVLGHNMLDYNFTDAPMDWLGEGTWASSIRWSCSANWLFLSGWGRGDSALWHKQRFTGDQSLQAFIGIKMEYLRERDYYEQRFRDVAITICGDGYNPRSGYSAIYGAPDADGTPNKRTVLMRNGVVVASRPESIAGKDANHHHWFNLQLRNRAARWNSGWKAPSRSAIPIRSRSKAAYRRSGAPTMASRWRVRACSSPTPRNRVPTPVWWRMILVPGMGECRATAPPRFPAELCHQRQAGATGGDETPGAGRTGGHREREGPAGELHRAGARSPLVSSDRHGRDDEVGAVRYLLSPLSPRRSDVTIRTYWCSTVSMRGAEASFTIKVTSPPARTCPSGKRRRRKTCRSGYPDRA